MGLLDLLAKLGQEAERGLTDFMTEPDYTYEAAEQLRTDPRYACLDDEEFATKVAQLATRMKEAR